MQLCTRLLSSYDSDLGPFCSRQLRGLPSSDGYFYWKMFNLLCSVIIVSFFHWIYFKSFVWFLAAQAGLFPYSWACTYTEELVLIWFQKHFLIIMIYCWYQLTTSALIISDLWITFAFEHHMICDTKSDHQMGVSDPAILIIRLQINGSARSSIVHFIHVMAPCHGNSFHITGCLCVKRIHLSLVNSPHKGLVMWDFDVWFDVNLNKLLSKQLSYWWFEIMLNSMGLGYDSLQFLQRVFLAH